MNAFGILVSRFRVLFMTMEHRPKVVRDIVLTCVVLHNMLRSHQWGVDRPPTLADDIQPPQDDQKSTEGGQTSKKSTQRLFQQPWALGGQEDRI